MADPAGRSASPEWKQFLHLGEALLEQQSTAEQCQLISSTIEQAMGGQVDVWLAHPYYPLPGEPDIPILPSADAPTLVQKTYASRQACCQARRGVILVDCCVDDKPQLVAVPLITQSSLLGIIQVQRDQASFFTQGDLDYLEGLSAHAALAMQVSRQAAIKNWRNEQLALVGSVSAQITNVLDIDQLCQTVTALIQRTFNYYYVAIFTRSSDGTPRFCASASFTGPSHQFAVDNGEGMIGYTMQQGLEMLAPDVSNEPRYRCIPSLPETKSEFSLPLKVEGRILGVLDVQSDQRDAFQETDLLVLRALADNIALAIEGAHLYSTLQRRADQISAVLEVSHALTSILDPDRLLEEIVQVIHRRFSYPYVHVLTVHSGRRMIFYRAGSGERSKIYSENAVTYDLDDPEGIIPWVARTGKTLLANDVSREPLYRPGDLPPYETNSELAIPLRFGEEVLGVLDLQSDTSNAFDENDRSLLEALSAPIAIAMRNAALFNSERWRHQVGESFREVAALLASGIELDDLLDRILVALENNLPCDVSAIWLLDETDSSTTQPLLRLAASRGISPDELVNARQRSATVRAWLNSITQKTGPVIRQPGDPYGPLGEAANFPEHYSSIGCPLRLGEQVVGILTLAHHTSRRYGSEAYDLTATFASYAAVAIQNARLYHESREQAWISTVLLQVAETNQSVTTMEELLENTIRLIPLLIGVKKAGFFLWDENQARFVLSETYGIDSPEKGTLFDPSEVPALARLKETRSTLYIRNPVEELHIADAALPAGTNTLVMLPLVARGEVLGALLVAHQVGELPSPNQPFNEQTLSILQGIAHQTAIAVENIHLVENHQEEAYITAVLLQVAQAVVSQNNLSDILDTIVHLMPILVGIDACVIYLWDSAHGVFTPTQAFSGLHGQEREMLTRSFGAGEFGLLDDVRLHDTFTLCPLGDSAASPAEWLRQPCMETGSLPAPGSASIGSWLIGVPLSIKGEFFGVMLAKETSDLGCFREQRLEILNGVAQEVSLAIQNEKLQQDLVLRERIEREVQLAREIQRTFLPDHMPEPPGWDIDARWQTAREVGGDFYDLFGLGKNRLGIVIADVADKGMPAALYMTVTRALIRASVHNIHSPARVLERVNNLLVPDAQNGMFVTAVYAVLDLSTGVLTYANAGHNLPLLLRSGNQAVEQLPKGGMALGVQEGTPLQDEELVLQPGDCLILYTDGVTDTFSPSGQTFGLQRLLQVLSGAMDRSAAEVLDSIYQALVAFRETEPLSDDITLLTVCREKDVKPLTPTG